MFRDSTRRPLASMLAAVLLAGLGASATLADPVPFEPGTPQNFTMPSSPRSVVAGDINNDGILDMVVSGSANFSILLGLGGGTFAPRVDISAGNPLGNVVLADFNLDGKLDLAAPYRQPSVPGMVTMRGNGDGTFGVFPGAIDLWAGPAHADFMTKADFNHDGKMDVAICGYATSAGTASVYLNTSTVGGAISFARTDYAVGTRPQGISSGYLKTSTEFPDIVTANTLAGSLTILENDGTGHFINRQDIPVMASVYAVTTAMTFNDTDRLQIFTANKDSSSVSFLFTGDGTTWNRIDYPTAAGPRDVVVADADGDGVLDILAPCFTANKISILAPVALGGYQLTDIAAGTNPTSVAVVNFSGNLKNELILTNSNSVTWIPETVHDGWYYGDNLTADFTAPNQFGDDTHFSGLRSGKWVLLDICSSWCHPCRQMAESTQNLFKRWAGHPTVQFEYVTALVDGQTPGIPSTQFDALAWSNTFHINRPILHSGGLPLGGTRALAQMTAMIGTPTLRLIDPQGRIRWYSDGAAPESTIARVLANLAGVAIPPPVSGPQVDVTDGTLSVVNGNQSVDMTWDFGSQQFYVDALGFGENFFPCQIKIERDASGLESWNLSLTYAKFSPYTGAHYDGLPTADPWQFTLSNLVLDPAVRVPLNGGATVTVEDTLSSPGGEKNLQLLLPYTWSGGTLQFDPIPAAALAAVPPTRKLSINLLMQTGPLVTSVPGVGSIAGIALRAPFPNPARQGSQFAWSQPRAGVARLELFDLRGRHVKTLANGAALAGEHVARWDLTGEDGSRIGAGLYFARVAVEGIGQATTRVTVLR